MDLLITGGNNEEEEEEEIQAKRRRRRRLFVILALAKTKQKNNSFLNTMNIEGRRRRNRNIVRDSLLQPENSPWQRCYESGHDGSLITITGFDHETFEY